MVAVVRSLFSGFVFLVGISLIADFGYGPEKLELKGSHVIITGGSSGIGLAVAQELVVRGARVSLIARNPKRLDKAKTVLQSGSNEAAVFTVSADVTDHQAAAKAVADCEAHFGPVDALITSAGITRPGVFEELPIDEFEKQIRVNYLGTAYTVRAVVPGMKKRKNGRIVMVSSQAGQIGIYGYTAYSASKFALRGFAESLRMELAPHNVHVSVDYPPDTQTPQLDGEQEYRPIETTLISADSKTFQPDEVAKDLIDGMQKGQFTIATGFDGMLLEKGTCTNSPVNRFFPFEVVAAPIIRIVGGGLGAYFDYICRDQLAIRERAAVDGGSSDKAKGEL